MDSISFPGFAEEKMTSTSRHSVELPDKVENGSQAPANRTESLCSEREGLTNNASQFWRPMIEAYNSMEHVEMVWIGILGLATITLPLISLVDMVNNSTNDEFGKPFVLLTVLLTIIFICTAAMVSLVLLFVTNDWSVSVMLAQRWNPVSYAATYFITALCHFASAWVCAVYIMREMQGHGDPEWKICCSALSFIFIALSQLFPPANSMKPVDLGLGGLNVAFAVVDVNNEEVIPTLIPFSIGKEYLSTVIHIALRLTGSIMGYAVIFNFLSNNSDLLHFNLVLSLGMVILSLVLEVVALIAMVAMMAGSAPRHERDRYKRTFFGLEACFLYCMIIGVVLTVMAESSLFKHYKG